MRSDPKLLIGFNKLWIRFFLVAVYATMYVRDHNRPVFHAAMGIDPTEYDYTVFRITSAITRQVFPMTLDTDAPAFRALLEKMRTLAGGIVRAKAQGGIVGGVRRAVLTASVAVTFARLYLHRAPQNDLPATVRLQPAW